MNIEKAFNQLTGNTDNLDKGFVRGTTKSEVKKLCGKDWDENSWLRMVKNSYKDRISNEAPFYDKKQKLWFWI